VSGTVSPKEKTPKDLGYGHDHWSSSVLKATDALVKFFNKTKFEYSFLGKSRIS